MVSGALRYVSQILADGACERRGVATCRVPGWTRQERASAHERRQNSQFPAKGPARQRGSAVHGAAPLPLGTATRSRCSASPGFALFTPGFSIVGGLSTADRYPLDTQLRRFSASTARPLAGDTRLCTWPLRSGRLSALEISGLRVSGARSIVRGQLREATYARSCTATSSTPRLRTGFEDRRP